MLLFAVLRSNFVVSQVSMQNTMTTRRIARKSWGMWGIETSGSRSLFLTISTVHQTISIAIDKKQKVRYGCWDRSVETIAFTTVLWDGHSLLKYVKDIKLLSSTRATAKSFYLFLAPLSAFATDDASSGQILPPRQCALIVHVKDCRPRTGKTVSSVLQARWPNRNLPPAYTHCLWTSFERLCNTISGYRGCLA